MYISLRRSKTFEEKIKIIFGKPDDIDPRIREYLERKLSHRRESVALTKNCQRYAKWQTGGLLIILFLTILFEKYLNGGLLLYLCLFIIVSVITTGAVLEQKRWIVPLEIFRLLLTGLFICIIFPDVYLGLGLLAACVLLSIYYDYIKMNYLRQLFQSDNI